MLLFIQFLFTTGIKSQYLTKYVQQKNMRQLHIFSIKPKFDIQLFHDFCFFPFLPEFA